MQTRPLTEERNTNALQSMLEADRPLSLEQQRLLRQLAARTDAGGAAAPQQPLAAPAQQPLAAPQQPPATLAPAPATSKQEDEDAAEQDFDEAAEDGSAASTTGVTADSWEHVSS